MLCYSTGLGEGSRALKMDFSQIPTAAWTASNELAFAFRDKYPVSPGHTLIVPRRVVATWFEASREEQRAMLDLLDVVKASLDDELQPDGYNVGFNAGQAAGQTIEHLHVHVIPRYRGDVEDPTGGVRHVRPGKGNYLRERERPLITGGAHDPFHRALSPLLRTASEVAILAAFVQDSGLQVLEEDLMIALENGARVRLITGDYLNITQERALRRLLDWEQRTQAFSKTDEDDEVEEGAETEAALSGSLEVRVVETAGLPGPSKSFHPKSWRIEGPHSSSAFVGSSNISRSALRHGIEWNARIDRWLDPKAYECVAEAFEQLWPKAQRLDQAWLDGYQEQVRSQPSARELPLGEVAAEAPIEVPTPNEFQRQGLEALAASREDGRQRALVVMATGLGKTWFSAFDCLALEGELGRVPRVLFLAHRRELLRQAAGTFRTAFPTSSIGFFVGSASELHTDLVFASVQKLARRSHLAALEALHFDYVIVDEVHHAAAPSYRRILSHVQASFFLGLTATPDRADGGDVEGLFDDHLPFRADLGEGIDSGLLVPFRYQGLKDSIDYKPIPWRNGRFDPAVLGKSLENEERMKTLWRAWNEHPGKRTLVFCASIAHATYACDWLNARGVRARALHSGPESANRDEALAALTDGELDALCSVDLFNEGLDLPSVDRVVMLRPTESPIVFLQQLGRGLRTHPEVEYLQVIDFVGNHRVFLDRVRRLLSLTASPAQLREFLISGAPPELPPGCSVELELEAKDLLSRLLPGAGSSAAIDAYRSLKVIHDDRPTAGELYRRGYNPKTVGTAGQSWFEFVEAEGDLSAGERSALQAAKKWLEHLQSSPMTKCFKMVVLEVLAEAEALTEGMELAELAQRSHKRLLRSPALFQDLVGVKRLPDPKHPDPAAWLSYWNENPVNAWSSGAWFQVHEGRLISRIPGSPQDPETRFLTAMTLEVVDWRLAQYQARHQPSPEGQLASTVKVTTNGTNPILMIGNGPERDALPHGDTEVRLPGGEPWIFSFVKIAVNVARPSGKKANALPTLLRDWFGEDAGQPGTQHSVRFTPSPDGWWIEPCRVGTTSTFAAWGPALAFPSPQAARRATAGAAAESRTSFEVRLPGAEPGVVAIRARSVQDRTGLGLEDGDWMMARMPELLAGGRPAGPWLLLERESDADGFTYTLERHSTTAEAYADFTAPEGSRLVASVVQVLHAADLAPQPGTQLPASKLAETFHLTATPAPGLSVVDGHAFLLVESIGQLSAPDRCSIPSTLSTELDSAHVLIWERETELWHYAGVGQFEDGSCSFPALSLAFWKSLGGQGVSRSLPRARIEEARLFTERVFASPPADLPFRLLARSASGALQIDGGPDGFKARSVSVTDLAWVLIAKNHAARHNALLDEVLVNKLRYLDGTPKRSTRWIDTGHALRLVAAVTDR